MKKTKKVVKSVAKQTTGRAKASMPTWAVAVNWVVLLLCLVFGLFLFGSAISGLNDATIETSVDQSLINSRLWLVAFLFATMAVAIYSCVKIYYKNITGYIGFFLTLLFFALYMGMMSSPMNITEGTALTPLFVSVPVFTTYIFAIPAIVLIFVFLLMLKYLKSFSKQDIVVLALYIVFFFILAPSSLSTAIDYANRTLNIK